MPPIDAEEAVDHAALQAEFAARWERLRLAPSNYWGVIGALGWIAARDERYVTDAAHDAKPLVLTYLQKALSCPSRAGEEQIAAAARGLIEKLGAEELAATQITKGDVRETVAPVRFADAALRYHDSVRLIETAQDMRFAAADIRRLWPAPRRGSATRPVSAAELQAAAADWVERDITRAAAVSEANEYFSGRSVARASVREAWAEAMKAAGRPIA